jgi:hypothetical protein
LAAMSTNLAISSCTTGLCSQNPPVTAELMPRPCSSDVLARKGKRDLVSAGTLECFIWSLWLCKCNAMEPRVLHWG